MDAVRESVVALVSSDYCMSDDSTLQFKDFNQLSSTFQIFRRKDKRGTSEAIRYAHKCINTSRSRLKGLLLLHQVLDQCDTTIFQDHASSWSQMLLNILQSYNSDAIHQMAAEVLSELLRHAVTFPALSREFAMSLIPSLIPTLLDAAAEWESAAFRCLKTCLQCFPGASSPLRNKIEARLIDALQNGKAGSEELSVISQCYALLALCGGGAKALEGWSLYSDKLIGSLHDVLDILYVDLETDADSYVRPTTRLFNLDLPDTEPQRTLTLVHYYSILSETLADMLRPSATVTVQVPVEDILALVCRATAISPKFLLTRPTQQRVLLCSVLPAVYKMALHMLKSLIICVETGLVAHCPVVNKLIVQILDAVAGCSDVGDGNHDTPFSELKQFVYEVSSTWLIVAGATSAMATVADSFIVHVLTDAKQRVETVKGIASSKLLEPAEKILEKRKKKKAKGSVDYLQSSWQHKTNAFANWQLCSKALEALRQLILHCGTELKPFHHKKVQDFIIPLLLSVIQLGEMVAPPYRHPECRRALYSLLEACVLVPSALWPPPIHVAIGIFSKAAVQESDLKTRSYCHQALIVCQDLIHPRVPPVVAPQSVTDLVEQYKSLLASSAGASTPQPSGSVNTDPELNKRNNIVVQDGQDTSIMDVDRMENGAIQKEDIRNEDSMTVEMVVVGGDHGSPGEGHEDDKESSEKDDDHHVPETIDISSSDNDGDDGGGDDKCNDEEDKNGDGSDKGCDPEGNVNTVTESSQDPGEGTAEIQNNSADSASSTKRKHDISDADDVAEAEDGEPCSKKQVEDVDLMLQSFVDADPDLD